MGISLMPDPTTEPDDPLKPKPVTAPKPTTPAPLALAPAPKPTTAAPAPTVAAPMTPVDRVQVATDTYNNLVPTRQAQYEAESRDNIRTSAGLGQIASGGIRTREGDLRLARDRDLDTARKDLALKAAEGSIADATTAYQQGLAGSQQTLSEKIGLAGIENQKGSLDLAKQQADIDAQYKAGTLTLAQAQQKLAELQNTQSYGLEKDKLALATSASDTANKVALGQLSIAQATAELDEKVRTGQLTLAEKNQALAEITQQQNQGNETQRIQLAKDQLAQTGAQFGLSLAQQKDLATIADKTANRSIDVSSNGLLLELARIMGSGADINPDFLAKVAASLGISIPPKTTDSTTTNTKPQIRADGTIIQPGDPDYTTRIPGAG